MRKLFVLPLLSFLVACGDGNPFQPDTEISLNPDAPEVSVAAKRGGVKMVPFKAYGFMEPGSARAATEEEMAACEAAGGVSVDAAVLTMNVTHMGKSEYRFWDCWGEDFSILFYHGTVVAANGDELYFYGPIEGEWETFEVDWTADPVPWTFGPMTITGGTGRFENATGSFTAWGWSAYDPEIGWYGPENWDGMISSVGSTK
jgi:hypothetical protein